MSEYYEELLLDRIKELEEEYEYMLFCENPPHNLDVMVKKRLEEIKKHITSNKY